MEPTKDGYYKFVDQNLNGNAEHVASCCNKAPAGLKNNRNLRINNGIFTFRDVGTSADHDRACLMVYV